jgi:hypothetical protein
LPSSIAQQEKKKQRKENPTMSNASTNREQDQLFQQTPTQLNPGAAKPSDFIVEDRDGGQRGDSETERAALLAEADRDAKSSLSALLPDRNEVPAHPVNDWIKN